MSKLLFKIEVGLGMNMHNKDSVIGASVFFEVRILVVTKV